ncbi:hypothetical protein Tco_0475747 [Tanacetum coccineum]
MGNTDGSLHNHITCTGGLGTHIQDDSEHHIMEHYQGSKTAIGGASHHVKKWREEVIKDVAVRVEKIAVRVWRTVMTSSEEIMVAKKKVSGRKKRERDFDCLVAIPVLVELIVFFSFVGEDEEEELR